MNVDIPMDDSIDEILYNVYKTGAFHGTLVNVARVEADLAEAKRRLQALLVRERIDELKLMQGGDVDFQRYSEYRIAELEQLKGGE